MSDYSLPHSAWRDTGWAEECIYQQVMQPVSQLPVLKHYKDFYFHLYFQYHLGKASKNKNKI